MVKRKIKNKRRIKRKNVVKKSSSNVLGLQILIIGLTVCVGLMAIFGVVLSSELMEGTQDFIGCDGVEEWISNTNYETDAYYFLLKADEIYNHTWETKGFNAFANKEDVDCKSISLGLMCIAEYYGKDCFTYNWQYYSDREGLKAHIGVKCVVNEADGYSDDIKWKVWY